MYYIFCGCNRPYDWSVALAENINNYVIQSGLGLEDHWLAVPSSRRANSVSVTIICMEPINDVPLGQMFVVHNAARHRFLIG